MTTREQEIRQWVAHTQDHRRKAPLMVLDKAQLSRVTHLLTLLDAEREKTDITLYWLLKWFLAQQREGWEEGPTENEVSQDLVNALSNIGLDPYAEDGAVEQFMKQMEKKPRRKLFA